MKIKGMDFLLPRENHETFFKRVGRFFPPRSSGYRLIERAYETAKREFKDIYRETGERYFEHLRAVAIIGLDYLRLRSPRLIVDGLLHDLVEDIKLWNFDRVAREFGEEIAVDLNWLSKPKIEEAGSKEEAEAIYHERLVRAPRHIFFIKLPDRWHNLRQLWVCDREKIERKILETERVYLPLAEREIILIHELESALADARKLLVRPKKA